MAKYEVTLTEAVYYTIVVEATDETHAEELAWAELQDFGKDSFDNTGEEWLEDVLVEEQD